MREATYWTLGLPTLVSCCGACRVMPGELHTLLERCRTGEAPAWERFTTWVKVRSRVVLGGIDKLSDADSEDAVAEALRSLVTIVRRGEICGASNAEIDAHVCTAIRNRALNVLRGRERRGELDHRASPAPDREPSESSAYDEVPDGASPQDARAVAAEGLAQVEAANPFRLPRLHPGVAGSLEVALGHCERGRGPRPAIMADRPKPGAGALLSLTSVANPVSLVACLMLEWRTIMPDDFEYISRARLEYRDGYRNAYLGEVAEPVVYGVQGALREYYGAKEGPPVASTLDHIVAAVAG